jgi:Sjogren's syndrome/scleroderma autoantigen 1 (Autoantigen p27)
MDIENINCNLTNPAMQDDEHIEQLLSEKLMEGYVLLEKSCPVCSTPLVKGVADDEDEGVFKEIEPVMIPKGSFMQPFIPVEGVPLCVACTSHVVTQDNELNILTKCGSLKAKGGILVAAPSSKEPEIIDVTQYEDTHDDEKKEEVEAVADITTVEYSVR